MVDPNFALKYVNVYYTLLVLIALFTFILNPRRRKNGIASSFLLFAFCMLFIGLRPYSTVFTDMPNYKNIFEYIQQGGTADMLSEDFIFRKYMQVSAATISLSTWFFLTSLLYTWGAYKAYKNIFNKEMYPAFLLLVTSFFFFSYGTNTIRAGLAGSLALLGISQYYRGKKISSYMFFIIAIGLHKSLIVLVCALLLSLFYKRTSVYLFMWGICFFLSGILQFSADSYILRSGIAGIDQRVMGYFGEEDIWNLWGVFRWDFFLYGILPILWGTFFVWRKKFNDKFYLILLNTYITINAIWILVIRMSYTDRFAYIGWILIPIIIAYPLVKKSEIIKQPYRVLAYAVTINIALTLFLYNK